MLFLLNFFLFSFVKLDAPTAWGLYFQDTATPLGEGIIDLNNSICFYLIIVAGLVFTVLFTILLNFRSSAKGNLVYKYLIHGSLIEIIWTCIPAFILIIIAIPTFKLIYLIDEMANPALTVKAVASQWFWTYQLDFLDSNNELIEFDSYAITDTELTPGDLRLLDVDQRLVIPAETNCRLIVTSNDVIHSFALPSCGVKIDALPGRLNQANLYIQRPGVYYGQCSELCGVGHANMPIALEAVPVDNFLTYLQEWN